MSFGISVGVSLTAKRRKCFQCDLSGIIGLNGIGAWKPPFNSWLEVVNVHLLTHQRGDYFNYLRKTGGV